MNGKPGDHPLTDVIAGLAAFTPEVDALIQEVYDLGGLRGQHESNYLFYVWSDYHRLRQSGVETEEPEVLRQLKEWLLDERARLRGE